jgi:hypothetical protein
MRFSYLLAGLLSFLAALLFTLPADKALSWWGGDLRDIVRLHAPQGGIASGSASAVSIDGFALEKTDWSLKPLSLLKARIGYELNSSIKQRPAQAHVEFSLSNSVHVHALDANVSIVELLPLMGLPLLPIDGLIHADMQYMLLREERLTEAEGIIHIRNAEWRLMRPALVLGSYQLDVRTEDSLITAVISSATGAPVDSKGSLTLDQEGHYEAEIYLRANRAADPRLGNLLKGLGKADAQGWYRIEQQGQL